MRYASDIYEHPILSDSEVWSKDAYNRSGTSRLVAAVSVISVAGTLVGLAIVQIAGLKAVTNLIGVNESAWINGFRL